MHVPNEFQPRREPAPRLVADDETLVSRHLLGVWRYLRMLGCSFDVADDLTQDAFVTAWQKGARDLDPSARAAFLRRTARFLYLRSRHRRQLTSTGLVDAADALWRRDCKADDGDALVSAVRRCVAKLAERARRAVELSYRDERSRAEVARELGMKENGVKTLLQRTRQVLRECVRRMQS